MLNHQQQIQLLKLLQESIEIPDSAYEKAKSRYDDLAKWLSREESTLKNYYPYIFPQGSFRLGTVIKPLNQSTEYDLDLNCLLSIGITTDNHTQKAVKELVGNELEQYRQARNIVSPLKPKHRCWRLEYQDVISFHMDTVPSIPATSCSINITDDRHQDYNCISDDWLLSNPEGYALWFENRCKSQVLTLDAKSQIDNIPLYKRKTILQQVVQLLKRHRDVMFCENESLKPASIIITTLAAMAYNGEIDLPSALSTMIPNMKNMINSVQPRIPNPTNREEDFADRWIDNNALEHNFFLWLAQAEVDFSLIMKAADEKFMQHQLKLKFAVELNENTISENFVFERASDSTNMARITAINNAPRPWYPLR